jgi:hypothetical protein
VSTLSECRLEPVDQARELTKTPISIDKRTGGPNHVIVQLTDPLLFRSRSDDGQSARSSTG